MTDQPDPTSPRTGEAGGDAPAARCSQCGARLPGDAPGGHCPQCLLLLALDDEETRLQDGDGDGEGDDALRAGDREDPLPTPPPIRSSDPALPRLEGRRT